MNKRSNGNILRGKRNPCVRRWLRRTHRPLQTRAHLCSSDLVSTDAVVQITMTQRSLRSEAPSHHKLHRLLRCLVRISFSSMDDYSSPRTHHRPLQTAETTTGSDFFPTIIQLFRSHLLITTSLEPQKTDEIQPLPAEFKSQLRDRWRRNDSSSR